MQQLNPKFVYDFEVNAGLRLGSVLSLLVFSILFDVATYRTMEGPLHRIVLAGDLVHLSGLCRKYIEIT